jgi:hypothetical protein
MEWLKCIAFWESFRQDRRVKAAFSRPWLLVVAALMISGVGASGDSYSGRPLVQARFDQLIPTSYPTIRPGFHRLVQTTWPLTDPGIARLPMTQNLLNPFAQPLLIVNGGAGRLPATKPKRESVRVPRPRPVVRAVPPRTGGKMR